MKAGCPPLDRLRQLLAAPTRAADEAGLAAHVETCPHCQQQLEQLTQAESSALGTTDLSLEGSTHKGETFLRRLMTEGPTLHSFSGLSFLRSPSDHDEPATRPIPVIPDYEILGELGSGGMGIVYQARQVGLDRLVALKMLRTDADPHGLARFKSEAAAVARLQHPHIVQIFEIGTVEGRPFLCLEYVRGGTLSQRLHGSPLAARPAAQLVATLARAVQHAHEQGIIHRDLKPSNILLADRDTKGSGEKDTKSVRPSSSFLLDPSAVTAVIPKITDFGLAKLLDARDSLTASGDIMGTPDYMAPEQASGREKPLGPGADIHALGVILYEVLTGRLPYHGETPLETLLHVIHAEPVPPRRLQPQIPPDLETITLKCLEKEPTRRYATALELAQDLERFLAGEPIAARPPSAFYQWRKFARRNKALVGGVIATLLALAAGLIATGIFAMAESQQRQQSDANAKAAENSRLAARREAYQARLVAALGLLQDNRADEAAAQLAAAPPELRGWEWRHLHSRLDDSLEQFPMPVGEGRITPIWNPDGWRAISFADFGIPRLRDLHRQPPLRAVDFKNALQCLPLPSRPGKLFVLEENEGNLAVMDDAGAIRLRFTLPRNSFLTGADLSPDGKLLALSLHEETRITILDASTGKLLQSFAHERSGKTNSVAFSPDGKWLVSGHGSGNLVVWDTMNFTVRTVLKHHRAAVPALAFNHDGSQLASGANDRAVCLWDMPAGKLLNVLQGHTGLLSAVAFSPDGQWLASAGREGSVRLWSVADQETAYVLKGHTTPVLGLLWSPDGRELASASDMDVRLWGLAAGGSPWVLRDHQASIYTAAYSQDGKIFASGAWDSRVRVWDAVTGAALATFPMANWVASVAISPDGKTLVGRGYSSTIRVWDLPQRQLRATIEHHGFVDHALMHTVAISPDGKTFVAPIENVLRRWDLATLQELAPLRLPAERVRLAVFSPDGKTLAIVGKDHVIYLVEADSGRVVQTLRGHEDHVQIVAFHPEGRRLVSGGKDRRVLLWDITTGTVLHSFRGHTGEVFAAAFHPQENRLVTGGRDRVIRIWDIDTGEPLLWLEGHRGVIFSLAFSPDGHTLISAAGDRTIRLWDDFPVAQRLKARPKRPPTP